MLIITEMEVITAMSRPNAAMPQATKRLLMGSPSPKQQIKARVRGIAYARSAAGHYSSETGSLQGSVWGYHKSRFERNAIILIVH